MPPAKKLCMVCGDKALGYNFNAVTCESCKAFFRRNALSNKNFVCPFSENCEVNAITRKFCQRCRLKKCFKIGMKKEHIMSEEDKIMKKKKIEQNRAKRKLLSTNKDKNVINKQQKGKIKRELTSTMDDDVVVDIAVDERRMQQENDSSSNINYHHELWSTDKIKRNYSDSSSCGRESPCDFSNTSLSCESYKIDEMRTSISGDGNSRDGNFSGNNNKCPYTVCYTSTAKEIVNSIVNRPDTATQILNHIMRTPKEAVDVVSRIINSPTEAMRFISHLILYPGDALKIISKIMNSPLDALTVFTKFMSSPTDSLQIISRIVNSPGDVLQFIQQLMHSPEDAINIMKKFMNTPAEALKMINNMVNNNTNSNRNAEDEDKIEIDVEETATMAATPKMIATSPSTSTVSVAAVVGNIDSNSSNMIDTDDVNINNNMLDSILDEVQSPVSSVPSPPEAIATNIKYIPITIASSTSPSSSTSSVQPSTSIPTITTIPNYIEITSTSSSPSISTDAKLTYLDIGEISFNLATGGGKSGDQMRNILEDVEDRPIQPNSIESVLCEAIKLEYETYNSLPQTVGDSKELNEAEKAKLNELIQASNALYYPVDEDLSTLINDDRIKCEGNQHDPKLLHVINLTAVAIRRLIKMSKKINAFRNMCQEDQVALLKGGCTEMMIMRSAMSYDQNKAIWKIPHSREDMSNVKVDVLKLAKGNVYEEHERFIRTFEPKWRMDENIILIMCAILLFCPTRPRVIHSDVIKLEQNSYYYLLRRYLESMYPGCEAKSTFIKLIQKITEVARLNEVIISVYLNVNPSHIEPLLREIFDMKNH